MQDIHPTYITTDTLSLPVLAENNLEADVLRLDKIHPLVSGNKWFKLRYYLEDAEATGKRIIVTYGGAWSNHILATAAACRIRKLASVGIIRGEAAAELSPTLLQAKELGMELFFISREAYRQQTLPEPLNTADHYLIPEGGYGIKGAEGAATILDHCHKEKYTHICCAAGTGTMTAGLALAASPGTAIVSVSVLKNNHDLKKNIRHLCPEQYPAVEVITDFHFGGYARYKPELTRFMNEWYRLTSIPSDFVYTGKLFFAADQLVRNHFFPSGSRLLLIHSGGLQGNASFSKGTLIF